MSLPASTVDDRQQLIQLLSEETESARELLELLEQEHQLLVKGEAEAIRSISEKKHTQIKRFNEQLRIRDQFLTARRLPSGKQGTDLFIQNLPDNGAIQRCWSLLQKQAIQLNDRNEVNGGIVAIAQRHIRQALNILTCHTEQNSTYGRAGQQTGRPPQSLAKV